MQAILGAKVGEKLDEIILKTFEKYRTAPKKNEIAITMDAKYDFFDVDKLLYD